MEALISKAVESLAVFLYDQSRPEAAPAFERAPAGLQRRCRLQAVKLLSMIGGVIEADGLLLVPATLTAEQLTEVQIACPITLPGEPEPAVLSPEVLGKVWAACLRQVRPVPERAETRRQTVLS